MKISREIKTAILVLSAIALFVWGYNFLKGKNIFGKSVKYYVEYGNVEGLTTSSNVTINGLIVGKVSNINIQKNSEKLLVEISMTRSVEIPKSSVAYIYSPGFIGGRDIAIELNYKDMDFASSGDYLNSGIHLGVTDKLGNQIDPIQKKLKEVLENANEMIVSVNSILDERTKIELKQAISNLSQTLSDVNGLLATSKPKLDNTLNDFNHISKNFSELSDSLIALDINGTFTKLDAASHNIEKLLGGIDRGEGTIGKLVKDDKLYTNLESASKELDQLLRDIKENPKRYIHFSVFGKKATTYQNDTKNDVINEKDNDLTD